MTNTQTHSLDQARHLGSFIKALFIALWRDMQEGEITLRAMGLVYTTLLSLAPLLALSFSVLKGFGVHNAIEPLLLELLAPLGVKAQELTSQVVGFVENVQVGVLGVAGLLILLYTVISLMQKIEEAFNFVWRVKKGRSLFTQFRDYFTVILLGPVLAFSSLGIWTKLSHLPWASTIGEVEPLQTILSWVELIGPTVIIIFALSLIYFLMPNTRVKWWAALTGGVFAGLVWQFASWVFASFVVSSGQQIAIYSIFASLFLFMLWLYVGWLIVLIGARLAYYLQYPDAVTLTIKPIETSPQMREFIAIAILKEVTKRFIQGKSAITFNELDEALGVSGLILDGVLDELIEFKVLCRDDAKQSHYLLCIDPSLITLEHIRASVWRGTEQQRQYMNLLRLQCPLPNLALSSHTAVAKMTLRDLALSDMAGDTQAFETGVLEAGVGTEAGSETEAEVAAGATGTKVS